MVISAIGIHKPVSHFLSPHTPWIIPALCSALFIPYVFIAWLGHLLGASICLFLIHETCPMSWEITCNRRAALEKNYKGNKKILLLTQWSHPCRQWFHNFSSINSINSPIVPRYPSHLGSQLSCRWHQEWLSWRKNSESECAQLGMGTLCSWERTGSLRPVR